MTAASSGSHPAILRLRRRGPLGQHIPSPGTHCLRAHLRCLRLRRASSTGRGRGVYHALEKSQKDVAPARTDLCLSGNDASYASRTAPAVIAKPLNADHDSYQPCADPLDEREGKFTHRASQSVNHRADGCSRVMMPLLPEVCRNLESIER